MKKKVNKKIRDFNKELKKDVFKDRFWVRQCKKIKVDGLNFYLYELIDNLEPERNYIIPGWIWDGSTFFVGKIFENMNDFIVKSDFWAIFYNDKDRYKKEIDNYRRVE